MGDVLVLVLEPGVYDVWAQVTVLHRQTDRDSRTSEISDDDILNHKPSNLHKTSTIATETCGIKKLQVEILGMIHPLNHQLALQYDNLLLALLLGPAGDEELYAIARDIYLEMNACITIGNEDSFKSK